MRPYTIAFLFLLFFFTLNGQQSGFPPCSQAMDWSQVILTEAPLPADAQKFLIVSNRPYIPDAPDGELFPNEVEEFRKVSPSAYCW